MNLFSLSTLFLFLAFLHVCYGGWELGNGTMPHENWQMAVGEYQGRIYLLSGQYTRPVSYKYVIDKNKFVQFPLGGITSGSYAQYYYAQDNIIWIVDNDASYSSPIDRFRMDKETFQTDITQAPFYVGDSVCLTGHEDLLYLVGGSITGWYYHGRLQIYNITDDSWAIGPSLPYERGNGACAVSDNRKLYLLGGFQTNAQGRTNENKMVDMIYIDGILNNSWQFVGNLSFGIDTARATKHGDAIFMFGGWSRDAGNLNIPHIHVIDTIRDRVVLFVDQLPYGLAGAGDIIVGDLAYIFGGSDASHNYHADWLLYNLSDVTWSPTMEPTPSPSNYPSVPPTTGLPTLPPTTGMPTTGKPSFSPTGDPTSDPTSVPTPQTDAPSASTLDPSRSPTESPTITVTTTSEPDTEGAGAGANSGEGGSSGGTAVIIIVVIILVIAAAIGVYYVMDKKKKEAHVEVGDSEQPAESQANVSAGGPSEPAAAGAGEGAKDAPAQDPDAGQSAAPAGEAAN